MEVILTCDIEKLGLKDEVVTVKDGYARNYLIPKAFATQASKGKLKQHQEVLKQRAHREKELIDQAHKTAEALDQLTLKIPAKTGMQNKLFGSITHADLSQALKKLGYHIDKKRIAINGNTIKTTGTHTAVIRLHRAVKKEFSFEVVSSTSATPT